MLSEDSHDAAVMRALSHMATGLDLSGRQLELLVRMTRGLARTELAAEMGVTVAAVDYHGRVIREISGLGARELVLQLLRDAIVACETSPPNVSAEVRTETGTFLCGRMAQSK